MHEGANRLWAAYVQAVAGNMPAQAIVDRIAERVGSGISQPTVSRWMRGQFSGELKPANVAAFATAFDRPVLQAFLAAGLLSRSDVEKGLTADDIVFVVNLGTEIKPRSEPAGRAPRRSRPQSPRD